MSAMLKPLVAWSLAEAVVSDFIRKGAHLFEAPLDPAACAALLAEIRKTRRFGGSLFLSEAELDAHPQDGAPNLLDSLQHRLSFVERAPQIVEALWTLLGPDYGLLDRRVVCSLPSEALPGWLKRRVYGEATGDLGVYVRPAFRDITYSCGVDFHQDLIGYADRAADFVTLDVHLHPVAETDAPLHLLEGSHRLGGQLFPHDLKRTGPESWRYRGDDHSEMYVTERALTGEAGFCALWHPCALHGTPPSPAGEARISLRYLFARGSAQTCGLDTVNATLAGPLSLAHARRDQSVEGVARRGTWTRDT